MKWKPEDTHHDVVVNRYTLTLAADDTHGYVTKWNVTKGEMKSRYGGTGRSVRRKLYFAIESLNTKNPKHLMYGMGFKEILIIRKQCLSKIRKNKLCI